MRAKLSNGQWTTVKKLNIKSITWKDAKQGWLKVNNIWTTILKPRSGTTILNGVVIVEQGPPVSTGVGYNSIIDMGRVTVPGFRDFDIVALLLTHFGTDYETATTWDFHSFITPFYPHTVTIGTEVFTFTGPFVPNQLTKAKYIELRQKFLAGNLPIFYKLVNP